MTETRNPLKKIEGTSNLYRDMKSDIIYYKDQRFKFSTKCKTLREAKKAAEAIIITRLKEISLRGAKREVLKIDNPLISELYEEMLEEKRVEVKPSTLPTWERSYTTGFRDFFSGDQRGHINDFTDQNLMKFKKWYLEDRGTRHARKMVFHMKYFLKWAYKHKVLAVLPDLEILDNLHELVEKKAKREPVGRKCTDEEIAKLLTESKAISPCAHLMVILGLRYGMRKTSEGLALLIDKVDFKKSKMQVWSEKNSGWRTVPITSETIIAVKDQIAWIRNEYPKLNVVHLFPMKSVPTKPMSSQVFDKIWKEIKLRAGIQGRLRFHDLRHTFATQTAEDNWPPIVACEALDMSLTEYQKTYCHPSEESVAEMMKKTHEKTQKNEGKHK